MMRAGFVTCVELGLACMEEIYAVGGRLDFAITLKDERATGKSGRVFLDEFCSTSALDLFKVDNINDPEAVDLLREREIDWLFIIGWSQIAHEAVLEAPRRGGIGAHPTLLPRGRGRAAIPWAILKGLDRTGVTFFQLDRGVDSGPILGQEEILLDPRETATTLYTKVEQAHRSLMRSLWPQLVADTVVARPQDESAATTWPGRKPEDGEIRPEMSVVEADRLVRAVTRPYPGAFWVEGDAVIRIWAGKMGEVGTEPLEGTRRIVLADGVFDATDFEIETASR